MLLVPHWLRVSTLHRSDNACIWSRTLDRSAWFIPGCIVFQTSFRFTGKRAVHMKVSHVRIHCLHNLLFQDFFFQAWSCDHWKLLCSCATRNFFICQQSLCAHHNGNACINIPVIAIQILCDFSVTEKKMSSKWLTYFRIFFLSSPQPTADASLGPTDYSKLAETEQQIKSKEITRNSHPNPICNFANWKKRTHCQTWQEELFVCSCVSLVPLVLCHVSEIYFIRHEQFFDRIFGWKSRHLCCQGEGRWAWSNKSSGERRCW